MDRSDKAPESGRRTKRQRNESHSLSQHDSSLDLHWLTCKTARQTSFGRTSSRLRTCHRSGCRSQLTSCQKERSSESHYCCWRRTGRCCTSSRRWSRWCTAKGKERTTNDWRARAWSNSQHVRSTLGHGIAKSRIGLYRVALRVDAGGDWGWHLWMVWSRSETGRLFVFLALARLALFPSGHTGLVKRASVRVLQYCTCRKPVGISTRTICPQRTKQTHQGKRTPETETTIPHHQQFSQQRTTPKPACTNTLSLLTTGAGTGRGPAGPLCATPYAHRAGGAGTRPDY